MFKSALPFRVGPERMTRLRLAFGLKRQHPARIVEDRGRGVSFDPSPTCISQRTEGWRLFSGTDIARNQICLFQRHIESGLLGELQCEHFLSALCSRGFFSCGRCLADCAAWLRQPNEPKESADAVLQMDDEIALVQFTEIDLRPMMTSPFGPLQTPDSVRSEATKKLRRRKHNEVGIGKAKAAAYCSFNEIN